MFEERLERLLERWKKAFGQYRNHKTEAEEAVLRWEWTTGARYSPLPFHFERFPGRGRVLKEAPAAIGSFTQYGFDGQGRVRVRRAYQYRGLRPANFLLKLILSSGLPDGLYSETFTRYSDDQIESIEFSIDPHIPLDIQQIFMENGRVVFFDRFRLNGYTPRYGAKGKNPGRLYEWLGYNGRFKTAEEYVYEGDRLRQISGYYEVPGVPPYSTREHFSYDDAGKLVRIDRIFEDGQKQAVYRKRQKGQTFQSIREEATQKLVEAIIQRVKAADIQEKVYCMELYYQSVTEHFPPSIILAPESYRLKIIQSNDPGDRYSIFSPILGNEWFFPIEDPQTLEMCQVLEQEIQAGEKWDTATRILRDVAAALTRHDWSGILNVTPDFVAFALDPEAEGDQMVDVLSSSVSKRQIQEWREKGWLE